MIHLSNLNKNQQALRVLLRGFTLIELLVVIAIIGILSSVVMSSVTAARTQAYDVKVKAQLSHIRNAAELYYGKNYNYGTANGIGVNGCSPQASMWADVSSGMNQLAMSANYPVGENTIICNSSGTGYVVSDNLATAGSYWCVDSLGRSTATSGPVVAGVTLVCK